MREFKNYFEGCLTNDDAKNRFRKLAHELHPDKGGSNAEFIELMKQFKNYKPESKKDGESDINAEEFYNLIKLFDGLEGVLISFVGTFIWLEDEKEGATKEQKELIKTITIDGYNRARWAGKRKKWYFSPEGYKQKFKSKKSFEELKSTWGAKSFKPREVKKIAY